MVFIHLANLILEPLVITEGICVLSMLQYLPDASTPSGS